MSRYRKVYSRTWSDEKFIRLAPTRKLVALYIITAQSNRIGIFRFSESLAAEETGLQADDFARAFSDVCSAFGWRYDRAARVLWIPTWWKYNPPNNEDHLKGCLSDLADVPSTPLMKLFLENTEGIPDRFAAEFSRAVGRAVDTTSRAMGNTVSDTVSHTVPHTESRGCPTEEQDRGTGAGAGTGTGVTLLRTEATPPARDTLTPDGLMELWNEKISSPACKVMTGGRRRHALARLREHPDRGFWSAVVSRVAATPFLRGRGPRRWAASLDWLIRNDTNATAVIEGKYDDGDRKPGLADRKSEVLANLKGARW